MTKHKYQTAALEQHEVIIPTEQHLEYRSLYLDTLGAAGK
jgi:hypothetical protein